MVAWLGVQRRPGEEGELVGVLARRRHAHRAGPVEVEVGQLVGEPLELVRLEPALVHDDVVAGRVDRSLPHRLGHKEEIIPEQGIE